ncbi:bifunctional NUDIX hydrolase/phosphatase PAP2 family protein [Photobacterium sp.]|uniref:bifunctional NUDIX hydrolase/phosphatase PAP2 family protein n=1 Tax=Photobacterium sp. TaxID=660 RepID=UPI00299DF686|nr:phosphatase PAP2 family protein [Photobacterium sp.]MDX1300961.1 phosphatase PAP2 family protein [Photobacterium sp.]
MLSNNTVIPGDIVGAVCVIRHADKIVMLSEVITQKLSLPGGYIDSGDTPEQAAAREALEETGLVVSVDKLLQYRGRAAIYSCQSDTPILVSSQTDQTGFPVVASWFSEHFGKEVKRVYLINPKEVSAKEYRYPNDIELLVKWLEQTPESNIEIYADLSERVSTLHRTELLLIRHFQQWIKSWPDAAQWLFDGAMSVLNLPGEAVFILMLISLVVGFFGPVAMLQLAVMLISVTLVASLIKHGISSPRPSYIIPELQQINVYGFGFPSGHTLMATVVWGMVGLFCKSRMSAGDQWHRLRVFMIPFLVFLVLGQAVARVWYGAHFISDIVASLLLGAIMLTLFVKWKNATAFSLAQSIKNKGFWLLVTIVIGLIASFTHNPVHVDLFAILLGIFLSAEWLPKQPLTVSLIRRIMISVAACLGAIAIVFFIDIVAERSTISLIVLTLHSVGSLLATIWLVAGMSLLTKKLAQKAV